MKEEREQLKKQLFYAARIDYNEYAAMNNLPTPDEVADDAINKFVEEIIVKIDWILTPHAYESDDPKMEKFALELKDKYKKAIIEALISKEREIKTMKTQQEIEKEFDEKFGESDIYVSSSDYNEQLLSVKSFIRQVRQDDIEGLIEWVNNKLEDWASDEHDRWVRWQAYLFSKSVWTKDGYLIPKDLCERWQRQIDTSYEKLSEQEKESDRKEVKKYLDDIIHHLQSRLEELN